MLMYRGDYYLFSTNQGGYWWSENLQDWHFVKHSFLTEETQKEEDLCAPAAWVQDDKLYVFGSTYTPDFPIWVSTDPKNGKWEKAVEKLAIGGWDPVFFVDDDGQMYCNTAFGDYPHYLPDGEENHLESRFTGWMLLNYNKPVTVSSTYGSYNANYLVDEDVKTYWCAATADKGEWIVSDLGEVSTVRAVQINYADQDAEVIGRVDGLCHQYVIYASTDGKKWEKIIDKSRNKKDVPHDYVELEKPVKARYLKMENVHMPTGKFALSGFRVFGKGAGEKPAKVENFIALRGAEERRNAWLKWKPVDDAYAYNIYFGTEKDKLYNCVMVCGANEYYFKFMDKDLKYHFAIEAINENGTSEWVYTEAN